MRKLLALVLILGLASMANAALELSINGLPAPDDITLQPSDWIKLDVLVGADHLLAGGDLAVILSNPQGHLEYDGVTFIIQPPTVFPFGTFPNNWDGPWQVQASSTPQQVNFNGGNASNNTIGPYVLMDNLWFHCDEPTDVIIDLVAISDIVHFDETGEPVADYIAGSLIDSIYVVQPEPMTLSLLGLGGLALLRRRR